MTPTEIKQITDAVIKAQNHQTKMANIMTLGCVVVGGVLYTIKKKHFP